MLVPHLDKQCAVGKPRVLVRSRRLRVVIFAVAVLLATALLLLSQWTVKHSRHAVVTASLFANLSVPQLPQDPGGARRLRIFMPADSPHVNLCKSILSAVALGYPPPTLLNWHGEFNRPEWHLAGSHIAKLESLLAVIQDLLARVEDAQADAVSQHDLVMLVDAYDIWFQLPPSVLIERYHVLNRQADERLRRQWQAAQGFATDFPISPPRQSIVVTSAKDCHPGKDSGTDPSYAHWPQSPIAHDLYGPETDGILAILDPARRFRKVRPRCVNSGLIMGPLGALRHALLRCTQKVERIARSGRQLWSDQALFGEVMGDQELWREWMRELGAAWNGTAADMRGSRLPPKVRDIAGAALRNKRFEFGIGLDYNFTTIPPTCSAEEDGFFVRLDNVTAVQQQSAMAGVPGHARLHGVPADLRRAGRFDAALAAIPWGDVPLYSDFFFGTTPVGIHHNAYVDNLKPWRIDNWWSMMWFYPHLRRLVERNLRHGPSIVAKVAHPDDSTAQDLEYWRGGDRFVTVFEPRTPGKGLHLPITWDAVCQKGAEPWHQVVFGDGMGPLLP
ncbi:hypothetical protein CDD81_6452 [Ophiocordyceps australis]|uniref:Uncharacterized protein n=1 Tax=Ophiocordyceps australis TaxID=1399860 RepID=A0A2C5YAT4_9HYPO|nr:hypothetical protein CDD81_6452 [Ophiocordyceps australis]